MSESVVPDMGLEVDTKMLSPADVWRDKDEFTEREQKSRQDWEKMNTEQRAAVIKVIERSLDRLRDTADIWVPASLSVKSGSAIDIKFRLMFTDIEDEIKREEFITSRTIAEAADNTKKLIAELEASERQS